MTAGNNSVAHSSTGSIHDSDEAFSTDWSDAIGFTRSNQTKTIWIWTLEIFTSRVISVFIPNLDQTVSY